MRVSRQPTRTIELSDDGWSLRVIDQRDLPHSVQLRSLRTCGDATQAIAEMWVRGAPLIGVTAAYGVALAMRADPSDHCLHSACEQLLRTRPTAVNLPWALQRMSARLSALPSSEREQAAYSEAGAIAEEDVASCEAIGEHGLSLLKNISEGKASSGPLRVLTHCNAGWLATVDWGTALAPVYKAHQAGIDILVYVDETRPRNQGASLTAWELGQEGIAHTLIVDNAGGHLMQKGLIDLCLVGSDRTTRAGDVCNKIGTYLKALAAHDNQVPFYVALPCSTIDWTIRDGLREIPIEERDPREVTHVRGIDEEGVAREVRIAPPSTQVCNLGFDVTPAHLVTKLITERGICDASEVGLATLRNHRNA